MMSIWERPSSRTISLGSAQLSWQHSDSSTASRPASAPARPRHSGGIGSGKLSSAGAAGSAAW